MNLVNYIKTFFKTPSYVIDYKIDGDYIKILSSSNEYRIVKNTKANLNKIKSTIKDNEYAITKTIDKYETESNERLVIVLIDLLLVLMCGVLSLFSFFTGIVLFYVLSILFFIFITFTTLISGLSIYYLAHYISKLKRITGYKEDYEIHLCDFKLHHNN